MRDRKGNVALRILLALGLLALGGFFANRFLNTVDKLASEESSTPSSAPVVLAGASSKLFAFDNESYDAAIKSGKPILLYFYANWCPICKKEFPIMQEVFNELATDKIVGFRINYKDSDTDEREKELASKYEVLYQHTKVFVRDGKIVSRSPESWDKNRYIAEINKF